MLTIQKLLDEIIQDFGGPISETVDTVKAGDASQPLLGVTTTFMATVPVIRKAVELGANLILTHEPTYFNHRDDREFLEKDDVFQAKSRLIEESGVVVARLHDYPHGMARAERDPSQDPFMVGLVEEMGWEQNSEPSYPYRCTIEPKSLSDLAQEFKEKLALANVRVAGDLDLVCSRVLLLLGASGINVHANALQHFSADVVVTGECPEWETFSYMADAKALGISRALIAIGHQPSEEPGMRRLTAWLRERFPEISVTHIPAEHTVRTL